MIQLYYKTVSKGGKSTYHPLTRDTFKDTPAAEITNRQAITIAATLILNITMSILDQMPEHKRVVREISTKLNEMVKLLQNTGEEVDEALCSHVLDSWNLCMVIAELTEYERAEA